MRKHVIVLFLMVCVLLAIPIAAQNTTDVPPSDSAEEEPTRVNTFDCSYIADYADGKMFTCSGSGGNFSISRFNIATTNNIREWEIEEMANGACYICSNAYNGKYLTVSPSTKEVFLAPNTTANDPNQRWGRYRDITSSVCLQTAE